jgi:ribonucleoside-diphosphate reductase alpha chain
VLSIEQPEAEQPSLRDPLTGVLTEEGLKRYFSNVRKHEIEDFTQFEPEQNIAVDVMPPQRVVEARRYRIKWPPTGENTYITITRHEGKPFEVFITTANAQNAEWVNALSRLLTAVLRRGGDVRFLVEQLSEVHSANGGGFIADQHKYRPSIVAAIGGVLEEEFRTLGILEKAADAMPEIAATTAATPSKVVPVTVTYGGGRDSCPNCGARPLVHEQGCLRCLSCDWNKC